MVLFIPMFPSLVDNHLAVVARGEYIEARLGSRWAYQHKVILGKMGMIRKADMRATPTRKPVASVDDRFSS
jgi:hypothetical protein